MLSRVGVGGGGCAYRRVLFTACGAVFRLVCTVSHLGRVEVGFKHGGWRHAILDLPVKDTSNLHMNNASQILNTETPQPEYETPI